MSFIALEFEFYLCNLKFVYFRALLVYTDRLYVGTIKVVLGVEPLMTCLQEEKRCLITSKYFEVPFGLS